MFFYELDMACSSLRGTKIWTICERVSNLILIQLSKFRNLIKIQCNGHVQFCFFIHSMDIEPQENPMGPMLPHTIVKAFNALDFLGVQYPPIV